MSHMQRDTRIIVLMPIMFPEEYVYVCDHNVTPQSIKRAYNTSGEFI